MQPVFKPYIGDRASRDVCVRTIQPERFYLDAAEAREDFASFRYIMDTAYSGKEYWENCGHSFEAAYRDISGALDASGARVEIDALWEALCRAFEFIHDGHLELTSPNGQSHAFERLYQALFADVLLEEQGNAFRVIESGADALAVGDAFSAERVKGHLYPTLSPTGRRRYLLGARSWTPVDCISLETEDGSVRLPLHDCRAGDVELDCGVVAYSTENGVPVVGSSRFWHGESFSAEIAAEFRALGRRLRDEPVVIWDIHDNRGGDSRYPQAFLEGLNEYAAWPVDCAVLTSPAIDQARGKGAPYEALRRWTFASAPAREPGRGVFRGALYLLISAQVGSSGEAAVAMARNIPGCVLIGENTGGRGVFGDTLSYRLPHSHIRLTVPHKLFLSGAEEGVGYSPDLWLDSPNLRADVLNWIACRG